MSVEVLYSGCMSASSGHLRIGELSKRVGVSPELLRAWERRYGLMDPTRSTGGFRLYSDADELRVRQMQAHLDQGLSAAQAAEAARTGVEPRRESADVVALAGAESVAGLLDAIERYDEQAANAVLDRALAALTTEAVLVEVVMPTLRAVGERWVGGTLAISQEHFAAHLLRGRLMGLARGWERGIGPLALLACPSGEQHDLPLLLFGISLRSAGWRIAFLGADTPIETIERAATVLQPDAVVLCAVAPEHLLAVERDLTELARRTTVAIGGPGVDSALAERVGAVRLEGDLMTAAAAFAQRGRP